MGREGHPIFPKVREGLEPGRKGLGDAKTMTGLRPFQRAAGQALGLCSSQCPCPRQEGVCTMSGVGAQEPLEGVWQVLREQRGGRKGDSARTEPPGQPVSQPPTPKPTSKEHHTQGLLQGDRLTPGFSGNGAEVRAQKPLKGGAEGPRKIGPTEQRITGPPPGRLEWVCVEDLKPRQVTTTPPQIRPKRERCSIRAK